MKKLLLFLLLIKFCPITFAQYCTSGGPSSTIDSNVELVQLNGNTTNINYAGCPGLTGVEDQTVQVADITAGFSYSLTIRFGTCGGVYAGAGTAWVDWNSNSAFDASEIVGTWTGVPPSTSVFNFTVPVGACNGNTRLRVTQQESAILPLDPCAAFTYGSVTDFTVAISGGNCSLASASYCTGGPTTNADSNVGSVTFIGNTTNINFTGTCPGYLGVQDATANVADVSAGGSYSLSVQFGTCGGGYPGVGQIWIDYNQNFSFESSESVGTWSGTPPVAMSNFTVNVPASAVNGTTRMRVMQYEGGALPLNPCSSFSWGSVADFTINVTGGISCTGYSGDYLADAIVATPLPYIDTNSTSICYTSFSTVYPSPDVYYKFITNPGPASVKVSLCNSSFDTYLSILDKTGTLISYNDDGICGNNSEIVLNVMGNDTLYAVVEGWNAEKGDFILTIQDVTGLKEINLTTNLIQIFPNPASEKITVSSLKPMNKILLLNVSGQVLNSFEMSGKKSGEIYLDYVIPGIYFVKVLDENGFELNQKIVIE